MPPSPPGSDPRAERLAVNQIHSLREQAEAASTEEEAEALYEQAAQIAAKWGRIDGIGFDHED